MRAQRESCYGAHAEYVRIENGKLMTGFQEGRHTFWKITLQNCEGWIGEESNQIRVLIVQAENDEVLNWVSSSGNSKKAAQVQVQR